MPTETKADIIQDVVYLEEVKGRLPRSVQNIQWLLSRPKSNLEGWRNNELGGLNIVEAIKKHREGQYNEPERI